MRRIAAALALPILLAPPAGAVPLVGGGGLTPNAAALADYIRSSYPGVNSIGGVRPCDAVGEHCRGVALDVMVGGNTGLGNSIYGDVCANKSAHSVRYCLWQVAQHHDHLHITVY